MFEYLTSLLRPVQQKNQKELFRSKILSASLSTSSYGTSFGGKTRRWHQSFLWTSKTTDQLTQLECPIIPNKYDILTFPGKKKIFFSFLVGKSSNSGGGGEDHAVSAIMKTLGTHAMVSLLDAVRRHWSLTIYCMPFIFHISLHRLPLWWYSWACRTAGSSSSWWMCTRPLPSGFLSSLLAPGSPTWGKCSNSTLTGSARECTQIVYSP